MILLHRNMQLGKIKNDMSKHVVFWRRRRDLNPRYPFGVYTISNRARSASYATSPCDQACARLGYNTASVRICQALFLHFSMKCGPIQKDGADAYLSLFILCVKTRIAARAAAAAQAATIAILPNASLH